MILALFLITLCIYILDMRKFALASLKKKKMNLVLETATSTFVGIKYWSARSTWIYWSFFNLDLSTLLQFWNQSSLAQLVSMVLEWIGRRSSSRFYLSLHFQSQELLIYIPCTRFETFVQQHQKLILFDHSFYEWVCYNKRIYRENENAPFLKEITV